MGLTITGTKITSPDTASIVHRCPPAGETRMPCCGRTPFEVPRGDRMTGDPALVTCTGRG